MLDKTTSSDPFTGHSQSTATAQLASWCRDVMQPSNDMVNRPMIYGCTTLTYNRHWLSFVVITGRQIFVCIGPPKC